MLGKLFIPFCALAYVKVYFIAKFGVWITSCYWNLAWTKSEKKYLNQIIEISQRKKSNIDVLSITMMCWIFKTIWKIQSKIAKLERKILFASGDDRMWRSNYWYLFAHQHVKIRYIARFNSSITYCFWDLALTKFKKKPLMKYSRYFNEKKTIQS